MTFFRGKVVVSTVDLPDQLLKLLIRLCIGVDMNGMGRAQSGILILGAVDTQNLQYDINKEKKI